MADSISILAALPGKEGSLESIFQGCRWELRLCGSCADIRSQFEHSPGVVLTADRLHDGDWKDVLVEVRRTRVVPSLIVASHVPDARLWREVLKLGGYAVLTIPFLAGEVMLSVSLAWRRWYNRWILAHQGPVSTLSPIRLHLRGEKWRRGVVLPAGGH